MEKGEDRFQHSEGINHLPPDRGHARLAFKESLKCVCKIYIQVEEGKLVLPNNYVQIDMNLLYISKTVKTPIHTKTCFAY